MVADFAEKLPFLMPKMNWFQHRNTAGSCQVHNCAFYSKKTHSAVILNAYFCIGALCLFISQRLPTNRFTFALYNLRDVFSRRVDRGLFIAGGRAKCASVLSNPRREPDNQKSIFAQSVWWDCWGKPQNRLRTVVGNLALPHCWH